ncbi:hypothetical protein ACA910_005577 [Epithemia clementina (nom. ined.)]
MEAMSLELEQLVAELVQWLDAPEARTAGLRPMSTGTHDSWLSSVSRLLPQPQQHRSGRVAAPVSRSKRSRDTEAFRRILRKIQATFTLLRTMVIHPNNNNNVPQEGTLLQPRESRNGESSSIGNSSLFVSSIRRSFWIILCSVPSAATLRPLDPDCAQLCQLVLKEASEMFIDLPPRFTVPSKNGSSATASSGQHQDQPQAPSSWRNSEHPNPGHDDQASSGRALQNQNCNALEGDWFWNSQCLQLRLAQEYQMVDFNNAVQVEHQHQHRAEQQTMHFWSVQVLNHCFTTQPDMIIGSSSSSNGAMPSQHVPMILLQRLLPDCIQSMAAKVEHHRQRLKAITRRTTGSETLSKLNVNNISGAAVGAPLTAEKSDEPGMSSILDQAYHSLVGHLLEQVVQWSGKALEAETLPPESGVAQPSFSLPLLKNWMYRQFYPNHSHERQTLPQREEQEQTLGVFLEFLMDYATLLTDSAVIQVELANQTLLVRTGYVEEALHKKKNTGQDQEANAKKEKSKTNRQTTMNPPRTSRDAAASLLSISSTATREISLAQQNQPQEQDAEGQHVQPERQQPLFVVADESSTTTTSAKGSCNIRCRTSKASSDTTASIQKKQETEEKKKKKKEEHRLFLFSYSAVVAGPIQAAREAMHFLKHLRRWTLLGLETKSKLLQLWRSLMHGLLYSPEPLAKKNKYRRKDIERKMENDEKDEDACFRIAGILWCLTDMVLRDHVESILDVSNQPSGTHQNNSTNDNSRFEQYRLDQFNSTAVQCWLESEMDDLSMLCLRLLQYSGTLMMQNHGPCALWQVLRLVIVDERTITYKQTNADEGSTMELRCFCRATAMARTLKTILQSALMDWAKRYANAKHRERSGCRNFQYDSHLLIYNPVVEDMLPVACAIQPQSYPDAFDRGFKGAWNRILSMPNH